MNKRVILIKKAVRRFRKKFFLPRFLREMKQLEIGGLSAGNAVRLLTEGDQFFSSVIRDIRSARKSINLETFIYTSDKVGWKIAKEIVLRAKKGVEVNIMYDAFGSLGTSGEIFSYLRENGVEIIEYHPVLPWRRFFNLTTRDHRKILVIDGRIAYAGGINIGQEYAGKKFKGGCWRDTHLRIEGPAVKDIQFFFIENWFRHGGSIVRNDYHFPELVNRGKKLLMVISTRSRKKIRPIFESYLSAIHNAKKSIHITNAYFIPDRKISHSLVDAVNRGVDVTLILPEKTDVTIVKFASRYLYNYYIRHGIKVFEYQKNILHAKTAVIDGVWSTVGSSNIDRLSLYINLELNIAVLDSDFGNDMESVFEHDLESCRRITAARLKKRPPVRFLLEWLAYRLRNIL